MAPGDDVGKKNIAMRDEDLAGGEVEAVVRREVRVVIAGDERDRGVGAAEKGVEVGTQFVGVRGIGAGAGVEGVAVEDEFGGTGEERADLREVADAAGAVAIVQVGKNAD